MGGKSLIMRSSAWRKTIRFAECERSTQKLEGKEEVKSMEFIQSQQTP